MAGAPENQEKAVQRGLDAVVVQAMTNLDNPALLSLGLQTLANTILGNEHLQTQRWETWLESGVLAKCLHHKQPGDTVLMVLVNLIQTNPIIAKSLMKTDAGNALLRAIYKPGEHGHEQDARYELIYLFTKHLVNQVDLKLLMQTLQVHGASSVEQIDLLKFVDAAVQEEEYCNKQTVNQLFALFHQYAERVTDLMMGLREQVDEQDFVILSLLLQILSSLSERLTTQQKHDLVSETDALGWLLLLLKDLHAHRPRLRASASTNPLFKTPEQHKNPFYLLKSDVVQVLGCLAYDCATVQNQTRERDAMAMILEMCTLDPENPCTYLLVLK